MPCHVDPIPPKTGEVSKLIRIAGGKIAFEDLGSDGDYPTATAVVEREGPKLEKRHGSFQYAVDGHTIVFVAPCPLGC